MATAGKPKSPPTLPPMRGTGNPDAASPPLLRFFRRAAGFGRDGVAARNPVHAVLFLILCFFNAAGLFLAAGRGIHRLHPRDRLCRRGRRAVPVRRHDARYQFPADCGRVSGAICRSALTVGLILLAELVLAAWRWSIRSRSALGRSVQRSRWCREHARHRSRALHRLFLSVSGFGPDFAGRHDRRDCPDAASQERCAPPERRREQLDRKIERYDRDRQSRKRKGRAMKLYTYRILCFCHCLLVAACRMAKAEASILRLQWPGL